MIRCECEQEGSLQSQYSPGVVEDDEPIVYALVHPLTGSFKDLSHSQLKAGTLSVCRAGHVSGPDARSNTVAVLLAKDETRRDDGFLYAKCKDIRAIKLGKSNVGAFCVVDDGLETYPAHAHLSYSIPSDEKLRNDRQTAKGNLLKLFRKAGEHTEWEGHPFKAA